MGAGLNLSKLSSIEAEVRGTGNQGRCHKEEDRGHLKQPSAVNNVLIPENTEKSPIRLIKGRFCLIYRNSIV